MLSAGSEHAAPRSSAHPQRSAPYWPLFRSRVPVAALRYAAAIGLAIILAILSYTSARAISAHAPDFEYFYKGGAVLFQRGALDPGFDRDFQGNLIRRGTIEWYLPFVSRFMTLFGWMPQPAAGGVWLAMNLVGVVVLLRLIGRYLVGLPRPDWPAVMFLPFVALLVFWYWEFRLNQIDILTMLLLVGGFVCWQKRKHGAAGFWLGFAILLKLTPGLIAIWFLLKRQYRTVAAAALTVILAGPVGDLVAFGPAQTVDYYRAWMHNAVTQGSHRGLILDQREMDWRNQSLSAVASRWLHPTNYNTHFDNDPRIRFDWDPRYVNIANLPREAIVVIVTGTIGALLLGLCWLARKPASQLSLWQLRLEWALFFLAMLWFMPVMRRYHLVWTLPAFAVLGACVHYLGMRSGWAWAALGGPLAILASQLLLLTKFGTVTNTAEGMGVLLAGALALGLPIVALLLRLARDPEWLPHDVYVQRHPVRESRVAASAGASPAPA